jgi:hypothetical protein
MQDSELLAKLQQQIRLAVQVAIPTLVNQIAYVDATFTKPNTNKWFEIIRAARNDEPHLSDGKQLNGSVRLILHWPKGGGALVPMQVCETIAAQIPKGKRIDGILISQGFLTGDPIQTDVDVMYPMTMRYEHLTR